MQDIIQVFSEMGLPAMGSIIVLSLIVGVLWKTSSKLDNKWIPGVVLVWGCILGIVAYFLQDPGVSGYGILDAAAIGAISGIASTGIHQLLKQLGVLD